MCYWLTILILATFFPILSEKNCLGLTNCFIIFALMSLCFGIISCFLVYETKGLPNEEAIALYLGKKRKIKE